MRVYYIDGINTGIVAKTIIIFLYINYAFDWQNVKL